MTILRVSNPVTFDPSNIEHRASLKSYLASGQWGTIRFDLEHPYLDLATMALRKLAIYTLNKETF